MAEEEAIKGKGGERMSGQGDRQAYKVRLGRSVEDNSVVVYDGENGLVTVGGAGSSKGRGLVIPNLLSWPDSVVVIDPGGNSATVTSARRGNGGGRVKNFWDRRFISWTGSGWSKG